MLAEAGEFYFGQGLNRFKEIVQTRLREDIEAEVVPKLVEFNEGGGLRIAAVVALEIVGEEAFVTLVTHLGFDIEIRPGRGVVIELHPLPVMRIREAA